MQYEKEILQTLLNKYQKRLEEGKDDTRRVFLKPSSLCRGYGSRTVNIRDKEQFDYAVKKCADMGYVGYHAAPGSSAVSEIWLVKKEKDNIEKYLQETYGIIPHASFLHTFQNEISIRMKGHLTNDYGKRLLSHPSYQINREDASMDIDVMKMLGFLEENRQPVYIREASMLVYGGSKYFEQPLLFSAICRAVRDADHIENLYEEREDLVLEKYHVFNVEQEIRLKGKIILYFPGTDINVGALTDGVAISSRDIENIVSIEIDADRFMTIENKTSFERFSDRHTVCMYLGGYANRHQIVFIKRLYNEHPDLKYMHFGDIDAGGLKIHQNLCAMSAVPFEMVYMGSRELNDPEYMNCLQPLTDNDKVNLQSIEDDPVYSKTIRTMKKKGKLEQEIISLRLMNQKDINEKFIFRTIHFEELQQAVEIEQICFPPNEACSPASMKARIEAAPELFLTAVDRKTGKTAGFFNGIATDEENLRDEFFTDASLHKSNGANIMLLGLDVLPEYRHQGLARALVHEYQRRAEADGRRKLVLTCLPDKVEMYEKFGFKDHGISGSQWGGEQWHEMVCVLKNPSDKEY